MSNGISEGAQPWSGMRHRWLEVKRCANGYYVKHTITNPQPQGDFDQTTTETRVFITNEDMLAFVGEYFVGEPKP